MPIVENKKSRTLINLLGVPTLLGIILIGGFWFMVFFSILIILGGIELCDLSKQQKGDPLRILMIVGLLFLTFGQEIHVFFDKMTILIFVGCLSLCLEIFRCKDRPFLNIATINFGMIWLGLMLGSIISIRLFPEYGYHITLSMFISVWICDTFAFVFGSKFGNKKILPVISPNKTWIGSISGFIGSLCFMYILHFNNFFADLLSIYDVTILALITGCLSQFGDFSESLLKREAGVKDTSDYLQGHGGILDRFDSLTIAAPLVLLYINFINL